MKYNYSFVAMPLMFELPSDEFKLLAILISQAEKYQSNMFFKSAKDLIDLFDKNHNNRRFNSALDGLKGKGLVETKRNFNKPNTFIIHFENFPNQIKKDEEKAENDLTGTSATVSAETASTTNTVSAETASTSWCRNCTSNIDIDNKNLENTIMNTTTMNKYSTRPTQEVGQLDLNLKNRLIEKTQSVVREKISTGADVVDLKRWFYDEAKPKMEENDKWAKFSKPVEAEFYKELRRHFTSDEVNLNKKMTDKDLGERLKNLLNTSIETLKEGVILQDEDASIKWLISTLKKGILESKTSIEARYFSKRLSAYAYQRGVKVDKVLLQEWYTDEINTLFNVA